MKTVRVFSFFITVLVSLGFISNWATAQDLLGQTISEQGETQFRKKPRIAVISFQNSNKKSKELGLAEAITSMSVTVIRNNSNYETIERNRIQTIVDEKVFAQMGLTPDASEKLIQVLDLEVILTGEVAYIGETIHIDARMIETRNSRVAVADFVQTNNLAKLRSAVVQLLNKMLLEYLRPWMGSITITSEPPGAEVYLDGGYVGTTALREPVQLEKLIEGKYSLKLIAGGYIDWVGEIVILPKMSQSINIPLIAKPGSMTVSSEPSGADVYLDKNLMGKTPLSLKEVAEGEHDLRLVKETYKEWSRKVVVRSFQPTDVKVTLEVLPAMLIVRSEPIGASVYFMGRKRGTTPVTLSNLTPGEVVLRLTKKEYEEWVSSFVLVPNETREINAELVRQVGMLSVTSTPDRAEVFLRSVKRGDRKSIGVTPIFNYQTTVGEYVVEFDKKNYYPASHKVKVRQGSLAEVSKVLEEKPGQILVETFPENARVFLDNAFVGRTPLQINELKRGNYSVKISLPYASFEEEISVKPDEQARLFHRFKKSKTHALSVLWVSVIAISLHIIAG